MRLSTYSTQGGFTLIETTIAAALSALFLSSVFTMNVASMDTIRCAKESVAASQTLQQRVESMRIANWQEITNADWISANLLNANAPGSDQLRNLSETLTLVPYGSASLGNTQLVRTGNTTTIVNSNPALLTENAIKVIWTVNYTGAPNDRATSRLIVAIMAQGGVAK
jgi:type II secretory pathway pseudopilin PulG